MNYFTIILLSSAFLLMGCDDDGEDYRTVSRGIPTERIRTVEERDWLTECLRTIQGDDNPGYTCERLAANLFVEKQWVIWDNRIKQYVRCEDAKPTGQEACRSYGWGT